MAEGRQIKQAAPAPKQPEPTAGLEWNEIEVREKIPLVERTFAARVRGGTIIRVSRTLQDPRSKVISCMSDAMVFVPDVPQ